MSATMESVIETRGLVNVEVRAIDEEERTAEFVAATEAPVETPFGNEVLRMSGVDLKRFKANPVVLDSHNRFEAGAIVGQAAKISVQSRQLVATVKFAETARAEDIWTLVRGGFIRAMSVGFRAKPGDVQILDDGETAGTGANRVEGPARLIKRWELIELSVVPVPADAGTLRRAIDGDEEALLRALRGAIDRCLNHGASTMADNDNTTKPAEGATPEAPAAPAQETRAAEPQQAPIDAEIRRREILAITPPGLEDLAHDCILRGVSVDDARKELLERYTKDRKPAGTPSAPDPKPEDTRSDKGDGAETRKVADIPDEEFRAGFCSVH